MSISRREVLLGALAGSAPRLRAGAKITPRADSMILLWMAGGMAQTETFDPKRYTPYETGLASEKVLSTFPSIPTALDGVRLSKGLEQIGSVLDRGTLSHWQVWIIVSFLLQATAAILNRYAETHEEE